MNHQQRAAERRQDSAQSEANIASETLRYSVKRSRARFVRRQSSVLLFLLLISLCASCKRNDISAVPGGLPQTAEPQIRSSADVVSLAGTGTMMSSADSGEALILLNIEQGYHVNANPATYPYLIATEITADKVAGLEVGTPVYPAAKKQKFQFADEPLAVYEGQVEVKLPLKLTGNGARSLPVHVRVQACDHEKCFPPATIDTTVSVEVK